MSSVGLSSLPCFYITIRNMESPQCTHRLGKVMMTHSVIYWLTLDRSRAQLSVFYPEFYLG